jgi:hypothetical protein
VRGGPHSPIPSDCRPMDHTKPIDLQLEAGRSIPMEIRRRTHYRSAHTGRELPELHAWVSTADPETHRWLTMALRRIGDGVARARDPETGLPARWQISWNSYGESRGVHSYTLILREAEELTLECLLLDGHEVHPYEYRESVVGGGLTLWAKMVGTRGDVTRISRLIRTRSTFPVVRQGIQDEPREMRLGVAEWSEYEDRIKYRLVLLDREITDTTRADLVRIEEENTRAALGYYANLVERLVDLLVSRGVVEDAEIAALRDAARLEPGVTRHEFWHVPDVDAL